MAPEGERPQPPKPSASQAARRPTATTVVRRPTLRMGPLTTTPVPPPTPSSALSRLGSGAQPRAGLSGSTARLTSSAQARTASGGFARGAGGPLPSGTVSLLRARAGRHGLAFDLRGVRHVDEPGLPGREVGRLVDLRALFDAAVTPGQTLAAAGPDGERLSLVVDAGKVELLRVGLDAIHPVPSPLGGVPALACVRALVVLDDGAIVLLIDPARLAPTDAGGA